MGFLDHKGESEFPFEKEIVFNSMVNAIPLVKGMKVENADKLQGRIVVKAGVSLMSWGENIPILLSEISENRTKVSITSSPRTGILFGGAFDLGKNRNNIEQILSATSRILSNYDKQEYNDSTNQESNNLRANYQSTNRQVDGKWYDNKLVTHILLIIFFPIGLYALWKSQTIKKWWKITATLIISIVVLSKISGYNSTYSDGNSSTRLSEVEKESVIKHTIIDYNVSERTSGRKTFIESNVVVYDSNFNEIQLTNLLSHLYDSIMNTTGYEYRKNPNSCNILIYPSIQHLKSGMGQWIGKVGKARNDDSPTIQTQFINKKTDQKESNDLTNISLSKQKEIWNDIIISEDKARAEAEKKYPILVKVNTITEINKEKEIAKNNSANHYEYQTSLLKIYKVRIIKKFKISNELFEEVSNKGIDDNWPFPPFLK
jgi:hypothetical protein